MLTLPPNKTFEGDFQSVKKMLIDGENFAFSRFSDGEVYIMQGHEVLLAKDHCNVKKQITRVPYSEDDLKHFNPKEHEFFRQKLVESFTHRQHNYIKGISCRCCIGQTDFDWQLKLLGKGYDDIDQPHLSWSNLMINSNYLRYISEIIPIFKSKKTIIICNKNASLDGLGFNIVKDFRVGSNCMVNDYGLIEDVKKWILDNNISDHLFLCAAASLSNIMIYNMYKKFPNNTYMDIGSSLNPFMPGIGSRRNYMRQFYSGTINYKPCVW